MGDFRMPSRLPQDLLLIQDFVSDWQPPAPGPSKKPVAKDEGVSSSEDYSSDEEMDSEDEVMNLISAPGRSSSPDSTVAASAKSLARPEMPAQLDSSSESESDSEPEANTHANVRQQTGADMDDDDENVVAGATATHSVKTAHEIDDGDTSIAIPDVTEIPENEDIEPVGRIINVMNRSVIVKGTPGPDIKRANERALDAETLLVFEDRRVLGYIHETFGPTYDPFYVVKFRSSHPVLTESSTSATTPGIAAAETVHAVAQETSAPQVIEAKEDMSTTTNAALEIATTSVAVEVPVSSESTPTVSSPYTIGRTVFHVPNRSRFVFVNELKRFKGSDASNVHDEEPMGNDVMDFSDDEAEAAHKRAQKAERQTGDKRKWSESASGSRAQTPSQMRDQDLAPEAPPTNSESFYSSNPYDEYSPYDAHFSSAGPSNSGRQIIAYDDPYANPYPQPSLPPSGAPSPAPPPIDIAKVEEILAAAIARPSSTPTSPSIAPPMPPPRTSESDERGRGGGGGRRGRGRGRGGAFGEPGRGGRGRGRGHDRGRGRGRGRGGFAGNQGGWQQSPSSPQDGYHPQSTGDARALSPTSQAIAHATGQYEDGAAFGGAPQHDFGQNAYGGGYDGGYAGGYGGYGGQPQVQPHINPRFAAQWGFQVPGQYGGQYGGQSQWDTSRQQNGHYGNGYGYPGGDSSGSGQGQ